MQRLRSFVKAFRHLDDALWLYHHCLFAALCFIALASLSFHLLLVSVFPDPDGQPASLGRVVYCLAVLLATLSNVGAIPAIYRGSLPPFPLGWAIWKAIDDAVDDLWRDPARFRRLRRDLDKLRVRGSQSALVAVAIMIGLLPAGVLLALPSHSGRNSSHWVNLRHVCWTVCIQNASLLGMAAWPVQLRPDQSRTDAILDRVLGELKLISGVSQGLVLTARLLSGQDGFIEALAALHVFSIFLPGWHVIMYSVLLICERLTSQVKWVASGVQWPTLRLCLSLCLGGGLCSTGFAATRQYGFVFNGMFGFELGVADTMLLVALMRLSTHPLIFYCARPALATPESGDDPQLARKKSQKSKELWEKVLSQTKQVLRRASNPHARLMCAPHVHEGLRPAAAEQGPIPSA